MTVPVADTLLVPVTRIDGYALACLIDASTGMVVAAMQDEGSINLPAAAGGAADIANVFGRDTRRYTPHVTPERW